MYVYSRGGCVRVFEIHRVSLFLSRWHFSTHRSEIEFRFVTRTRDVYPWERIRELGHWTNTAFSIHSVSPASPPFPCSTFRLLDDVLLYTPNSSHRYLFHAIFEEKKNLIKKLCIPWLSPLSMIYPIMISRLVTDNLYPMFKNLRE